MRFLEEDSPLQLRCPKCGEKFFKIPREIEDQEAFFCRHCELKIQPKDFSPAFHEAEESLKKLARNISQEFNQSLHFFERSN